MASGIIDHTTIANAETALFAIFTKGNETQTSSADQPNYP